MLLPFGGVVAAEPDRDESESDRHHSNPRPEAVESTADARGNLTAGTDSAATNTTDDVAGDTTETTRDTVDAAPTGSIAGAESLTGDANDTQSNGTDGAEDDGAIPYPIATVERLSLEIDSVTVTYQRDEPDAVRVVVDSDALGDDLQATPAAVDELAEILEAAAIDPDVVITLVDSESLESSVQLVDGAETVDGTFSATDSPDATPTPGASDPEAETDDRALAALTLPDIDEPVRYVPPLAAGLFVFLNPMSGLLSGVLAFLAEWAGRLAAVLRYSSRDGSDPLEHETRTHIDDLVTDTPGISLSDLSDRLETPLSTIRYHVKILERERYLTSRKHQGNRRIYPMGAATENEELAAAMDNESTATIIESLARQGQATVGDIVDDVGTTYSTVSHHLSRLADAGVVQKEKDGRCTVSKLDPSARTALHRDLEPPGAHPVTRASSAD